MSNTAHFPNGSFFGACAAYRTYGEAQQYSSKRVSSTFAGVVTKLLADNGIHLIDIKDAPKHDGEKYSTRYTYVTDRGELTGTTSDSADKVLKMMKRKWKC